MSATLHMSGDQSHISPVIVAPTYNNARTVGTILQRLLEIGPPVVVVNDGSSDETAVVLDALRATIDNRLVVLSHPHNRGKAAALRTGFDEAAARGHTHAVTIDTDGQLEPADIPALLRAA